ncbi:MAG TPA: ABC transporter substrate-binding protein [Burkholderiaceae bacterium]|jgi:ABC-type branched-subunit amino acid transport system substrate-binding protein
MNTKSNKIFSALIIAAIASTAFAEDGVTGDSILIGQSVGLTGQIAGPVKEMNEGANAYIAGINKQGGINGRKIRIVTLDDKFDPALTKKNVEALITQKHVFALFQVRGTPHTQAILPLLAEAHVPLIAPSTGASVFHSPVNRYLFNVRAKYRDEVSKGVEQFTTIGFKNIGLLHVDDTFGNDALIGFKNTMETRKLSPAIIMKFDRVKPEFDAAVSSVMKVNPQALIIVGSAASTAKFIHEFRLKGSQTMLMTLSNNSSDAFVTALGKDGRGVIVSQVTPAPHLSTTLLGQEFKQAAQDTHIASSYAAMEGFVSAKVLVEGLRRAGRNLTRESLINGLESIGHHDMGGMMLSYGPDNHSGSDYVELTIIDKYGRFIR